MGGDFEGDWRIVGGNVSRGFSQISQISADFFLVGLWFVGLAGYSK